MTDLQLWLLAFTVLFAALAGYLSLRAIGKWLSERGASAVPTPVPVDPAERQRGWRAKVEAKKAERAARKVGR